jgi:RNA methyltransferase, TrmH family
VKEISSRDNPLLLRLRKLLRSPGGYRPAGQVWLEGDHLCRAALARGLTVPLALGTPEAWASADLAPLLCAAREGIVLAPALFAPLSDLPSPAAMAFLLDLPPPPAIDPDAPSVVLDRVQDAGNVGSVLRSAAAFGFRQVIALAGTAALWSPKVLRAGMGAHFGLRLVEQAAHGDLAALRVPLLATSSHAADRLGRTPLPWPCAWVLGHEGQGIAPELLARCAKTLAIPQPGGEESLNVAAAAAVCLYASTTDSGWVAPRIPS